LSRIFLSHSSANNAEAVALRDWLIAHGFDDLFLDLDPERGLKAGQKWQAALKRAAERCELVIFLVSPDWVASSWCRAEFLLAQHLNKRIFGVIVAPTPFADIPSEMTAEWQTVDLTKGKRDHQATVATPGDKTLTVAFAKDGLDACALASPKLASTRATSPGRRRTILTARPIAGSSRSKPKMPASSSAAMVRPSSVSICCAG
jgi:hypothetical protein